MLIYLFDIGDGDPLDVVEVGIFRHARGQVVKVKVVGALALIDEGTLPPLFRLLPLLLPSRHIPPFSFLFLVILSSLGETDWKIICVDANDPDVSSINCATFFLTPLFFSSLFSHYVSLDSFGGFGEGEGRFDGRGEGLLCQLQDVGRVTPMPPFSSQSVFLF